jgi:glycosyltransferase involved in cell wall biosynthesis
MLIRVVDYLASQGGGARFGGETIAGILRLRPEARIEVVSTAVGLNSYRSVLIGFDRQIRFSEIKPVGYWRGGNERLLNIPGTGQLVQLLRGGRDWSHELPRSVYRGCDAVWLPWANRHLMPNSDGCPIVATIHDLIPLEHPDVSTAPWREAERASLRSLRESGARVVTSSVATAHALARLGAIPFEKIKVCPLGDDHGFDGSVQIPGSWEWYKKPYLIYPANISPHKNHEALLAAIGRWKNRYPLVLTGAGTESIVSGEGRGGELRLKAEREGLRIGIDLIPLGAIDAAAAFSLIAHAWACVIPSIAEGVSLPVLEALVRGVPLVCSDIAPIREQFQRLGGTGLWLNPQDVVELSARLDELSENYASLKATAVDQVARLRRRSWSQVAEGYLSLLEGSESRVAQH